MLRGRTLVAEPFLVIGLIAVVRLILIITAEGERFTGEQCTNLMLELGILTALVIALATALYLLRPHQRTDPPSQSAASGGRELSAPGGCTGSMRSATRPGLIHVAIGCSLTGAGSR